MYIIRCDDTTKEITCKMSFEELHELVKAMNDVYLVANDNNLDSKHWLIKSIKLHNPNLDLLNRLREIWFEICQYVHFTS